MEGLVGLYKEIPNNAMISSRGLQAFWEFSNIRTKTATGVGGSTPVRRRSAEMFIVSAFPALNHFSSIMESSHARSQYVAAKRVISVSPSELLNLPVLIVDDNFANRRVLQGMLHRWGMRPTVVEGGRAALLALEIAKSTGRSFPLILLDGQMPEMDGFTLAEIIQKDPELVGAAIVMLTSAGHVGDAARCRELGISAYLVKPVRQCELLSSIRHVLQKTPELKPSL